MGLQGAGYTILLNNILMFSAINVYMYYVEEIQEAVTYPDRRVFKDIDSYLKLGIPAAMTLCFEWWAYEIMILFCGVIGVKEQACVVIVSNFLSLFFAIPLGMRTASSSCIGKCIGGKDVVKAKQYYQAYLYLCATVISVACITLFFSWRTIFNLYTSSAQIMKVAESSRPLICLILIFDHFQGMQAGPIAALGIQS